MLLKRKFEILLLLLFFIFFIWLFNKSFGYNAITHEFRIARHQVGDFGLHLSLIRSFSWGDNIPPELPFYPGRPLPYHYYFDFIVGILEKSGVNIAIALNGLSVLSFTVLLFFIYLLSQRIFFKSKLLGALSVILFIFHSNLTFIDFFKNKSLSVKTISDFWHLPDYIHVGPFDGSLISIFFTLNVYLNQRHLILALAICLGIFYFLIPQIINKTTKQIKDILLVCGILLGFTFGIHSLITAGTLLVLCCLLAMFRKIKEIFYIVGPFLIIASLKIKDILSQEGTHAFFNPTPHFFSFWFVNLGIAFFLIPLGFILSNSKQRKILLSFLPLFVIGNVFQLSFRIDHNHSLFNLFFIVANFFIAFVLIKLWRGIIWQKILFLFLTVLLTISGVIDLMPIKNDYQLVIADAPKNTFMAWMRENTYKNAIFLAKQELLDPVTLSGRRNFLGPDYYLSVMGYNFSRRKEEVKKFFEASSQLTIDEIRKEGIDYMVIPKNKITDFNYDVNYPFLKSTLPVAFEDEQMVVYKL